MSHGAAAELISAQWPSHVAPVPVSISDLQTTQMGFMAAELARLNNSTSSGSEKKASPLPSAYIPKFEWRFQTMGKLPAELLQ